MLLQSLKTFSLTAMRRTGVFSAIAQSQWRGQRLLILCFHGISISDEHRWNPGTYLPGELFEARLRVLRKSTYNVLPLGEAIASLRKGSLPEKSIVLTFDDGFHDFYKVALPLLNEYGYPATVYLTTYYSDYNVPVFGLMCSYLLWKARDRSFEPFPGGPPVPKTDLRMPDARRQLYVAFHAFAAREALSGRDKNELLVRMARSLSIDLESLLKMRLLHIMNHREVEQCSAAGIDIQLHTHRHQTPPDRGLFLKELEDNRVSIQSLTQCDAMHFCYPSGFVLDEFLPWLRGAGIQSATTCELGLATAQTDPLRLPRVLDTATLSELEFESWICGLRALLPKRRQDLALSGRSSISAA
jgi:peptidoglycan/xylan/chitin deacetylase (PgdA/CDA1 family)